MHKSTGRYTSAEIADLAPLGNVHVFRGAKRQLLELDDETASACISQKVLKSKLTLPIYCQMMDHDQKKDQDG